MSGLNDQKRDEFSVSEILRELKDTPKEQNTGTSAFDLEDILAEFSSTPISVTETVAEPIADEPTKKLPSKEEIQKQLEPKKEKPKKQPKPKKEKPQPVVKEKPKNSFQKGKIVL